MSKIASKPVELSSDIKFNVTDNTVCIEGPKGKLEFVKSDDVTIVHTDNHLNVSVKSESTAMSGTTRALLSNMVTGVSKGWEKKLLLVGVGYRATLKGKQLNMQLGFSHDINFDIPDGIKITVEKQTTLKIFGYDKQLVGEVVSKIKSIRPPEPYKGKGIKEKDQYILRKEGKKK